MKTKLMMLIVCAAAATLMSGCPPLSATVFILPGHWSFELSGVASPFSIVLLEDGSTAGVPGGPPPGSVEFAGTLTWMQMDEMFMMTQSIGGGATVYEYTGTVYASTYMEGTFMQTAGGADSGIWTASFVGSI